MATLPDLDTGSVSFLAYWNAIDQGGVSDIAPDETTGSSRVSNATYYDNGVEADYNLDTGDKGGRTGRYRCKEDGWIVVWIDRTTHYQSDNGPDGSTTDRSVFTGLYDLTDWTGKESYNSTNPANPIQNNTLERAINDLQAQFSNTSNITYSASDVGLYDYMHQSSTTATVLSDTGSYAPSSTGVVHSTGFQYTSGTTLNHAVVAGTVENGASSSWGTNYGGLAFEGTRYINGNNYGTSARPHAAIDLLDAGWVPNAGTEYLAEHRVENNDSDGRETDDTHTFVFVWE